MKVVYTPNTHQYFTTFLIGFATHTQNSERWYFFNGKKNKQRRLDGKIQQMANQSPKRQ